VAIFLFRQTVYDVRCTVNAFKTRLDEFRQHRSVKFDFTADLTGTGNRSEEVILFVYDSIDDADLEVSDTCVRSQSRLNRWAHRVFSF